MLRVKLISPGEKRETSTKTCNETMLRDKLRVFVSRISPPLYSDAVKEGMIHLLVGSYVQKPDSVFFSDWSTSNTPEMLRSYWLSYLNKTSGQKVG